MKFIMTDGYVKSNWDGDVHHITRAQLSRLYKIPIDQTVESTVGVNWNWISLHPRQDGQYEIARCVSEQIENTWMPLATKKENERVNEVLNNLSFLKRLKYFITGSIKV